LTLLVVVLVVLGGIVAADMKSHDRLGGPKPSTNWRWNDEWNSQTPVAPVTPVTPVTPPVVTPPVKPPEKPTKPQGQIVASDYADAISKSSQFGMPVFVLFTADWCAYCKKMKEETLPNAEVKQAMMSYIMVIVNTDQNRQIAQKYSVRVLPTFVITNNTEKVLKSGQGFQDAQTFAQWLNDFKQPQEGQPQPKRE
jgi:thiol-disulfide isomerase/thioredoxin